MMLLRPLPFLAYLLTGAVTQRCPKETGIAMIVARGSTETGLGILGNITRTVADQYPGSVTLSVNYPATLQEYQYSEGQGVDAATKLVQNYNEKCPGQKVVMMGYSQGAQVISDVLCGRDEKGFNSTDPVSVSDLAAVLLFGDPSFVPGEPWDRGTATKGGIYPRRNTTACASYDGIMASYCNSNDTICDSGDSLAVHHSYIKVNGVDATDFIFSKLPNITTGADNSDSSAPGIDTRWSGSWIYAAIFLYMSLYR